MAKQRKHGSGTVRLRSDGRWEGRVVIGYDDSGLPKTKNVLAKTKAECEKKLKSLIAAQKGSEPQPPRQTMTVAQWLDFWYQTYKKPNLRPNTQMSYERRIYQHIIPNLGPTPLNKLTTGDIQQFYTGLKQNGRLLRQEQYGEGLSDQTVRGIHTTFHAALDKAVSEKIIPKNLSDFCRLPSAKAREMQVLSPEEIQRLLIQAKEDGCFELLLLELSTGLRRGEICALQWDDLNFNTGELQVKRQVHRVKGELAVSEPKTKASNRSVILPPPVLMVLSNYKTEINSAWMFPSPLNNDSPRDPAAVRKRLTAILERAGCKRVRFHDLRHPYVKHTTKIFSLRLMDFQAQAYPDARRKTRGACQLLRVGQSRSPVRPLCNRKRFSCLPPQSKMSWILYAISMRLSGYTSTRSISSSASSVVSVSASKIALDASLRLSCRACSSCFCFACANTTA